MGNQTTEHHFQPTPIVEELLSTHLADDAIWDNTNPRDVSFDTADDVEITTSIHVTKELIYDCRKFDAQDPVTTTISMSHDDDKEWFNAHEEFDLLHNTPETLDDYKERDKPPNIFENIGIINEPTIKHIEPDFYISERQT